MIGDVGGQGWRALAVRTRGAGCGRDLAGQLGRHRQRARVRDVRHRTSGAGPVGHQSPQWTVCGRLPPAGGRATRLHRRHLAGRHVTEPTELDAAESAGYWAEVMRVARALIARYEP